ncbi:MAG: Error-prone polymerase [Planctomycetota bacterium]
MSASLHPGASVALDVISSFSFLEGASRPEELVRQAAALGVHTIAIADRHTLAGAVRTHMAARDAGIRTIVAARVDVGIDVRFETGIDPAVAMTNHDGARTGAANIAEPIELILLCMDHGGYSRLCQLITLRHAGAKSLAWHDLDGRLDGLHMIVVPRRGVQLATSIFHHAVADLARRAPGRVSLALSNTAEGDDDHRWWQSCVLAEHIGVPVVATHPAHMHVPERQMAHDVLCCIRHGTTLERAGALLAPNAERFLRPPPQMQAIHAGVPHALDRAEAIATACAGFDLGQVRHRSPRELVPHGHTPMSWLRVRTWQGATERHPDGVPERVRTLIEHEFKLIEELDYAPFFLTVDDIVRFARSRGILCQGRGAAANSAVCWCLGITAVDPARVDMLFERFVSRERNEPPDIDVDFEHERREEVIQYIYRRFGRERAALCAEAVCMRGRMAVREVAKAMGFPADAVDRMARGIDRWMGHGGDRDDRASILAALEEAGFRPGDRGIAQLASIAATLIGFPRHLSQHVGGFVLSDEPLCTLVPVRDAAMPGRSIIEWDKDDIEAMGILKVDVLALGMLTCIRKALDMVARCGSPMAMHQVPAEDAATYDMLCRADSVGVFQVESRAQMSMLPRLKPRCWYDLVVQVAIVRPGPIHGKMVHPYLRRRSGQEPIEFPDDGVRRVLERTLGVPLFQEQAMALAVVAAGFTAGEADALRRAIAAWKRRGDEIARFERRLIEGMVGRGYGQEFAEQVFTQIKGFSGYGFPESHAASFAHLVYVSAWLKCHHPAAFTAALLNSQPMGFYAPAQLVRDAQEHGVQVRQVDAVHSDWDCTLERHGTTQAAPAPGHRSTSASLGRHHGNPLPQGWAIRLGMRMVRGLSEHDALAIHQSVREHGPRQGMMSLWRTSRASLASLRALARADAFRGMGLDRQQALWQMRALKEHDGPLHEQWIASSERSATLWDTLEEPAELPPVPAPATVLADYGSTGLSLKAHPISFLRGWLSRQGCVPCALARCDHGLPTRSRAAMAGLVLVRQRPSTAKGTMFLTIEDESGSANVIVRPEVYDRFRRAIRASSAVIVRGRIERRDGVSHLLARSVQGIDDVRAEHGPVTTHSRDFR